MEAFAALPLAPWVVNLTGRAPWSSTRRRRTARATTDLGGHPKPATPLELGLSRPRNEGLGRDAGGYQNASLGVDPTNFAALPSQNHSFFMQTARSADVLEQKKRLSS